MSKDDHIIETQTATGGIELYDLQRHEFVAAPDEKTEAWRESLYESVKARHSIQPPTADTPYSSFYRHAKVAPPPPTPDDLSSPLGNPTDRGPALVRVGRFFRRLIGG